MRVSEATRVSTSASETLPRQRADVVAILRRAWFALEPLWVAGLLALCLLAGHALLRGPLALAAGKSYDWAQFIVVGAVFPALLMGGVLAARRWPMLAGAASVARCGLVLLPLAAAVALLAARPDPGVAALALAQLGLTGLAAWRGGERVDAGRAIAAGVVALVAWTLAVRFAWWAPWPQATVGRGLLAALACVAVLAMTVWYVWPFAPAWPTLAASPAVRRALRWLGDLAALAVMVAMAVFPIGRFQDGGVLIHWGVYVGVAEMVRQGGWIFWDVPSQYGFLSVLALAALPTDTAWQSLFLLNAAAFVLTGFALYRLLRAVRPGPVGWLVALGSSVAAVFFVLTASVLDAPFAQDASVLPWYPFPSQGPYRFGWCYLLVALLVWLWRTDERSPRFRRLLAGGCAVWVVGVLWSVESAFVCSAAWLPAFVLLVWGAERGRPDRVRRLLAWLALPPALLAGAVAAIAAVYLAGLGRLPDWRGFFEYAVSFGEGFAGIAVPPLGIALPVLLAMTLVAMAAVPAARGMLPPRSLALMAGAWGASWSVSSYFVARGYSMVAGTAMPMLLAAVGLVLLALMRSRRPELEPWDRVIRGAAVPIVAFPLALLLAALAADPGSRAAVAGPRALLANDFSAAALIPSVDPDLQALIEEAGVRRDDPIAFAGAELGYLQPPWILEDGGGERVVVARPWLPATPIVLLAPLDDARKTAYTERYVDRARRGGWLIRRTDADESGAAVIGFGPWLFAALDRTHVPTRILERGEWQMVWYDFVGPESDADRLPAGALTAPALPTDLLVDGKPLSETAQPEVWGVFGDGWGAARSGSGGRVLQPGATLYLYAPAATTARLRIAGADGSGRRLLTASVDGGAPASGIVTRSEPAELAIDLAAGWNEVRLDAFAAGKWAKAATGDAAALDEAARTSRPLPVRAIDVRLR